MLNIHNFCFNLLRTQCYILDSGGKECVIVDPGDAEQEERDALDSFLSERGLEPVAILLTHAHFDHFFDSARLQRKYGIPVYIHPKDAAIVAYSASIAPRFRTERPDGDFKTTPVEDGDRLDLAGLHFQVIHTPGHTPGGVAYLLPENGVLFSGDTLFAGTIGRTDLEFGEYDDEIRSIMEKLIILPGETAVYPGHGPATTIAAERESNPMLEPFNEPEEEPDPDAAPISIHS